ncbi:MAG TPA: ABC transporter ATP-binding protein [Solirubrobacterales bacterium]|nr:ABC transporter ATP-binding protein [Solirubrobacterales bacterium]
MTASLTGHAVGHAFGSVTALEELDLSVEGGEILAVVGPSGCGKSTLLELICGLREPTRGTIDVGGREDAAGRLERCAYMPQTDCLLPWYSAIDNAGLALRNRGLSRSAARERSKRLFTQFGLSGFEDARPDELSGGMRQRVAFLRTLLSEKDVLLLDEPFAALDAITRAELQEWLRPVMAAEERTAVLVTHDVEEALFLGDRVAVMSPRPGRITKMIESPGGDGRSRSEVVTAPEFTALRQRILSLLTAAAPSVPARTADPAGAKP